MCRYRRGVTLAGALPVLSVLGKLGSGRGSVVLRVCIGVCLAVRGHAVCLESSVQVRINHANLTENSVSRHANEVIPRPVDTSSSGPSLCGEWVAVYIMRMHGALSIETMHERSVM